MYIETSQPRKPGDKARLISPTYKATSGRCLQFYYYMTGRSMGSLNIYMRKNGKLGQPVWSRSGNQPDRWWIGQATLNSDVDFEVRLTFIELLNKILTLKFILTLMMSFKL